MIIKQVLTREHPPEEELVRYLYRGLDELDFRLAAVERHVACCEHCQEELYRLEWAPLSDPLREQVQLLDWIIPKRFRRRENARGALADMQLICGAGPYELDVLVREIEGPSRLEVVGQVTRANRIYEPVADLYVNLVELDDPAPITSTLTDEFGEFDVRSSRSGVYGLRLGETESAPCVLIWDGSAA